MHFIIIFFKTLKYVIFAALAFLVFAFIFLFVGTTKPAEDMTWGVNFSQKHAQNLGLDWKATYLALMDDLGAKRIKIAVHWDISEPSQFVYDFSDVEWMLNEADKRGVKVVPVIGMKTPRWPECHIPDWAKNVDRGSQEHWVTKYVEAFVTKFKGAPAIAMWQVENEPFFVFGDCPWQPNGDFLKSEVDMVHRLDPSRDVMVTDSGEFSLWWGAAKYGDIVGSTMYRKVWFTPLEMYVSYPFPPIYYARRAWVLDKFFSRGAINSELQAEPWGPRLYYDLEIEEQMKTMDLAQFRKNVDYARRSGLKEAYFWGGEWWYWMKEKHQQPEFWNEAKELFQKS